MRAAGWAGEYIGTPFAEDGRGRNGCDCWGLVRLILGEVFGVEVPSHAGRYDGVADHEGIAALVEQDTKADDWLEVARDAARSGDVVLLRMRGLPIHVGIFAGPGLVLHTLARDHDLFGHPTNSLASIRCR